MKNTTDIKDQAVRNSGLKQADSKQSLHLEESHPGGLVGDVQSSLTQ